ncbi:MAG: hypothetical protein KDI17_05305 [Halioglobus sp.]|nr:hypothetical protein [Halioglobus sp.]
MKFLFAVASACLLLACTHEQVYNSVQQNQQLECSKLPQVQYEDCMKGVDQSYQDYERERQVILDSQD